MRVRHARGLRWLDRLAILLGLLALAMLLCLYGFPAFEIPVSVRLVWSALLPLGLFLDGLVRLLWVDNPWRYLAKHPVRYVILLMIVLELSGVATWSTGGIAKRGNASFVAGEIYLVIFLLGSMGSWVKGAILANRWLATHHVPVLLLPGLTLLVAIALGGAILSLPGLHQRPVPFLDSWFTATSALCVTGLVVYDVPQTLTVVGQVVLVILVQLGGLGTMTVLGWLTLWQRGQITMSEHAAFSELIGGMRGRETRQLLRTILLVTILVELLGAIAFGLLWRGRVAHPLPMGAFHAVSAFCNAGFALFSGSFATFRDDHATLMVLMMLVVVGGAGFPVILDLTRWGARGLAPWLRNVPLQRASRVMLVSTGVLVACGTLAFLADAWLQGRPRGFMEAVFQSVTTRTAGFELESQRNLASFGLGATVLLMAIGASAQSTGGGIKTSVIARLIRRLDPRDDEPSSRWLFTFRPFRLAVVLATLYLGVGAVAAAALSKIEVLAYTEAVFEAFSALGTVGLSRDVTANLSPGGKCIDMALMFAGRVLFPTLVIWATRGRRVGPDPLAWT